jgi:hypothetical protein
LMQREEVHAADDRSESLPCGVFHPEGRAPRFHIP